MCDQRRLRWDCAQVQSRQSLPFLCTQNNGRWKTSEGSGETVHKCSLINLLLLTNTNNWNGWPANAQRRFYTSAVSSDSFLLAHTKNVGWVTSEDSGEIVHKCSLVRYFPARTHKKCRMSDHRRLRGDCTQVQSRQMLSCSHTQKM